MCRGIAASLMLMLLAAGVALGAPLHAQAPAAPTTPASLAYVEAPVNPGPISLLHAANARARVAADSASGRMLVNGVLLGVVGFGLGGFVGFYLGRAYDTANNCDDMCGVGGMLIGAAIGESLGVALGMHAGHPGPGNLPVGAAAALGIAALGMGAAIAAGSGLPLLAIPPAQLFAVMAIELAKGRDRAH